MAFFESAGVPSVTDALLPKCGACGLYKQCQSPKQEVQGQGKKGILIVWEMPSPADDEQGRWGVGPAGRQLAATLWKSGVDLAEDCWMTGSLICKSSTDRPTPKQVDQCRPNMTALIKKLQPRVILLLGAAAVRSVIAPLVAKADPGHLEKWLGWAIPSQKLNAWICPTWNPLYLFQMREERQYPVIKLWHERHLTQALELEGRPWETLPNYKKQIRVEFDVRAAAQWIREKIVDGGPVAFDYETTCLKPHNPGAEIVCCSVCWRGRETIAYPFQGEAIAATRELLQSPCKKIGANNKFEEGWTRVHLGVEVVNWEWDCMQSAHHLDCREGITSVKHQAFVRFGIDEWASQIRPYLESVDDSGLNRIKQCDVGKLLKYCAMDSLAEYLIAGHQRKEMLACRE